MFTTLFFLAIVAGLLLWAFDIHIAVYRPKVPGRTTYFYSEIGNPETSQLNMPPLGEE